LPEKIHFLGIKITTLLEFSGKLDLMNVVVELSLGDGACGNVGGWSFIFELRCD